MANVRFVIMEVEGDHQTVMAAIAQALNGWSAEAPPVRVDVVERHAFDMNERDLKVPAPDARPKAPKRKPKAEETLSEPVHLAPIELEPLDPAAPSGTGLTITSRILAELQKGPLSSFGLAQGLRLEKTQVYPACADLKRQGKIVATLDDDGITKYWIKGTEPKY